MSLPEQIHVTYTEEDAQYLTVRPVMRQAFRAAELLDMIVSVTGKDAARVAHILRTGSLVYHFYRYRWEVVEAEPAEMAAVLSSFPDADPARPFRADECTKVLFLPRGGQGAPASSAPGHAVIPAGALEVGREEAGEKRMFRARSLWNEWMSFAQGLPAAYAGYSYALRGDVYASELSPDAAAGFGRSAGRSGTRSVRALQDRIAASARVMFLCPRKDRE